ncbi:MAG: hypothetical protein HYV15_03050, partial [Elusimicrobia bacterium]|nr:hypothetical protein [Elusimicrobiota bacterium]
MKGLLPFLIAALLSPARAGATSSVPIQAELDAANPAGADATRYDPPRLERFFDETLRGRDLSGVTGVLDRFDGKLASGAVLSDHELAFYKRALERVAERLRELRAAGVVSPELEGLDLLHQRLGALGER